MKDERQRKIIHVDMDAFFASVEQLKNPALRGKPVLVGGSPDGRGVVAAASYEARRYGVRSAMSSAKALQRCPHAIFVRSDFDSYKYYSDQIKAIFFEYTELVESLSLDEAYLDVSACEQHSGSATLIAEEIRHKIFQKTGLTASAGISYNKFLAKMASDLNKPNGMATILPEEAHQYLEGWEIAKFHGVGKAMAQKMNRLGIFTGRDLKEWTLPDLVRHFGKAGPHFFNIVRGIDHRLVEPWRERKSIGKEHTFNDDIFDWTVLQPWVHEMATKVAAKAQELDLKARTIGVKARYPDFETITRSKSIDYFTNNKEEILAIAVDLLTQHVHFSRGLRLIGLNIHNFDRDQLGGKQLELFRRGQ
jgi:DNA polymerase-4